MDEDRGNNLIRFAGDAELAMKASTFDNLDDSVYARGKMVIMILATWTT